MKKLRKTKNASTIIHFVPSKETIAFMDDMRKNWPDRIQEARKYFLLDIAGFMRDRLIRLRPTMKIGDKDWEYAKDLSIGILEESSDLDAVAIYIKGNKEKITQAGMSDTVLYFSSKKSSPSWVGVLIKHGPWPASMLPVKIKSTDANVISRRARQDEMIAIQNRILTKKGGIERELRDAGVTGSDVGFTDNAVGLKVSVDIGHQAMRNEMGFLSESQGAPWRSAFVDTKKYAVKCMKKIATYITDGDKTIFDLPSDIGKVSKSVIKDGAGFNREISKILS